MAKMRTRTETLLNAYLNNYQNANSTTVSKGQSAQQNAQSTGSAIMNATDKTLPVLTDYTADVMNGIVKSADNAQSAAVSNFKLAKKQMEAEQEAAAKAAKSTGRSSSGKSGGKGKSGSEKADDTKDTDLSAAAAAALADSGSTNAQATGSNTSAGNTKNDKKSESKAKREAWQKEQREQHAEILNKQAQQREKTVDAIKGTVTGAAKAIIGAFTAPARGGDEEDKKSQYQKRQLLESGRAVTKDGQINERYQELEQQDAQRKEASNGRSAASRAADLAKGTAKQAAGAILSFFEAPAGGGSMENRQAQHDMRMLMENGLVQNEDGSISDAYQKALDKFEATKNDDSVLDETFVPALGLVKEGQQQVAKGGEGLTGAGRVAYNATAMGANMLPGMALGLVNPALGAGYMGLTAAGNKVAEESEKGMNSRNALLRGAASGLISTGTNAVPIGEFANITKNGSPILQAALKEGIENAGQEAADYLLNTAADYALKDPDANFSLQDMAGQVGMGAATGAAFGALGGVLNRGGTQIANAENAVEQANQNVLLKDDNRITADQNDLYSALDNAQENFIPGLETDYAALAEQSRNAAQQARNEALRADPGNASDIMDAYDAALEALPTLQKAVGTDNTSVWNSRFGDTFDGDIAGKQYANVEGSRITAPVTIDTTNRAGYNVGSTGGVQNGTEIDAGRSLERTEPGRTGAGDRDVQGVWTDTTGDQRVFRQPVIDDVQRQAIESSGSTWGNIQDTTADPQRFSKALDESIAANKHGLMVSPKSVEELQQPGTITFMGEDGLSGALVTADGDIEAVFKNPASKTKRASTQLLITAVENGGNKLDCYGAELVNTYNRFGFEPVAKVEWNPDYAPDGWTYGAKDVYVMKLQDGVDANNIMERLGKAEADGGFHRYTKAELDALPTMEYEEALAYRDSLLNAAPLADAGGAAVSARPLNGSESVPANAVGAESTQYNRAEVPNQDYANQRGMTNGLDDAHRENLQTENTHQIWTDAEAKKQAEDDISTYIQQAGGDESKALDNAMQDLRNKEHWNKGDSATADEIRDRLKTQFAQTQPGTPEYYTQKARYEAWNQKRSQVRSETAQTMQSFHGDASERVVSVSKPITERWVQNNPAQDEKIKTLSDELAKLKDELRERDIADMEREAMQGVFENGSTAAKQTAGNMDAEFDQMLRDTGVISDAAKTDTTAEFDAVVQRVKALCEKNKVNCTDEAAKDIAGRILNGDTTEQYYDKLIMQAAGITDLAPEEMELVDTLYSKAATMPDSKERYDLEQQALSIMAKHLPAKSWFERFDNIRYLAMLGNPTTHARNLIGNVLMKGLSDTKDEVAAAMQLVTTNKADRTKALYVPQDMKDAASKWIDENHYTDVLKDGGKYNLDSGLERARSTYGNSKAGQFIQKISDFNSDMLDKEDEIFVKMGATHSLANILTARGYDVSIFTKTDEASQQALREALELAKQDAKDVTFHADTALTRAMNRISKAGDKNGTLGDKIAYCIGNGILPFAKTSANILKTAAEYNPVGAAAEAAYRGATHKGSAAVTDALAKGVVGSGIMGVGYWLAHEGFLTGTLNENTKNYDEMLGKQEYSVNIPGVGSYSIDWAAPAIVPLMMGANLEQSGYDLDTLMANPDNFAKMFGQASDIFVNALDPVTDMSMMQSLNNMLDNIRYNDESIGGSIGGLVLDAGTSYLRQYVPTVLSKAARTVDDTRRSSYGGGSSATERNANYLLRSTLNKFPVLSKNNEPYIDQWGREESSLDGTDDTAGGMFLRGAYNFGSPGYYSAENVTPVDEYLQGLYDGTGNSKVYPEKASSKITVDSDDYYMTPEEKTEYAKTTGQTAYDIVDSLRQNSMFLQLPEEQQAELVQSAYSVAKTVGGVAAVGDGVSGTASKAYQAYQKGGVPVLESYLLAKNAIDAAGDESEESLKKADKTKILLNQNLDSDALYDSYTLMYPKDEKVQSIYSQYGADGAKNWLRYASAADLDGNGSISQEEAQATLDKMNLTDQLKAAYWQMTNKSWKAKNNPY